MQERVSFIGSTSQICVWFFHLHHQTIKTRIQAVFKPAQMPRVGVTSKGTPEPPSAWGRIFDSYPYLESNDLNDEDLLLSGLTKVKEHLTQSDDGWTCCLICLGPIKAKDAIWSCSDGGCYSSYHLGCIQQWAKSSKEAFTARRAFASTSTPTSHDEASICWQCPKCRRMFEDTPSSYLCYCGKIIDPEWDAWIEPHSCGEACHKALMREGLACGHFCLLLCHPGPCPPCPQTIDCSCFCEKKKIKRRCGLPPFSCGVSMCGKALEGCAHPCAQPCHPPPCSPCSHPIFASCGCGSISNQKMPCSQASDLSCGEKCPKTLSCGRHPCPRACHVGPCGPCPSSTTRSCPCGSTLFPQLSCDGPDPGSCGRTCGKILECGFHSCEERCHPGPCPGSSSCKSIVVKNCRCGRTSKEALCGSELLCERKCGGMKACGRHGCKRRCCAPGACPPCSEICGRWLGCGNHKCPAPCHSGPCRPCPLTLEASCACGSSSSRLPCGSEKRMTVGISVAKCSKPCPVTSVCRHAQDLPTHPCHFGPCPVCRLTCGSKQKCGHECSASCHDPSPPSVPTFTPPPPPAASALVDLLTRMEREGSQWLDHQASNSPSHYLPSPSQVTARMASSLISSPTPCPPCSAPVPVSCHGSHEMSSRACHQSQPYSCGRDCGRGLPCTRHQCRLPCHPLPSADSNMSNSHLSPASRGGCEAGCGHPCTLPRSCSHLCPNPCHPGPCPSCLASIDKKCHCSKKTLVHPCEVVSRGDESLWSCQAACLKLLPSCSHPCRRTCHPGACEALGGGGGCVEEVNVRCPCRRRKERWPCHLVAKALRETQGVSGLGELSNSSAPKLLSCDQGCQASSATTTTTTTASSSTNIKQPEQAIRKEEDRSVKSLVVDMISSDPPPPTEKLNSKRLSKAEREEQQRLEALRKEEEREREARMKGRREFAVWLVFIFSGLVLGVYGRTFMVWIDAKLRGH